MHQLSPKSVLLMLLGSARHSSMSSGRRLRISRPSQEMKDLRLLAGVPILRVWGETLEFVQYCVVSGLPFAHSFSGRGAAFEHISKIFLIAQQRLLAFSCSFFRLDAVDYSFLYKTSLSFAALSQSFEILRLTSSFSLLLTSSLALLFLMSSSLRSLSIFSLRLASLSSVISLLSDLMSTSSFFLLSLPWMQLSSLMTSSFFESCLASCLFFSASSSSACSSYSFSNQAFLQSYLDYRSSSSLLPIYLVFRCSLSTSLLRASMSLYSWTIWSSFAFIWLRRPVFSSFLVLAYACASLRSDYSFLFLALTFLFYSSSLSALYYSCFTLLAVSSTILSCFCLLFSYSTTSLSFSSYQFRALLASSSFLSSSDISSSLPSKISFSFLRRSSKILELVLQMPHSIRLTDSSMLVFCFFLTSLASLSLRSLISSLSCLSCAVLLEKATISQMYLSTISVLLAFSFFAFLCSSASSCDSCRLYLSLRTAITFSCCAVFLSLTSLFLESQP